MHKQHKEELSYTPAQLESAYKAVIEGQQSVHKSAAKFQVPFHVLCDKVEQSDFPFVRKRTQQLANTVLDNKNDEAMACVHPMLVRNVVKLVLSNLKAQERIMAAQTCTVWGEMVYDSRTRDMIKARRKNQLVPVALFNMRLEWVLEALEGRTPKEILSSSIKSLHRNRTPQFDWEASIQIYEKKTCVYGDVRNYQEWSTGHSPVLLFTVTYWNSYNNFDWAAAVRAESIVPLIVGEQVFPERRKFKPVCCESGYVPDGYVPKSDARVVPVAEFEQKRDQLKLIK